jgi:hypothetical protein
MQAAVSELGEFRFDRVGLLTVRQQINGMGGANDMVRSQRKTADQGVLRLDVTQGGCDFRDLLTKTR